MHYGSSTLDGFFLSVKEGVDEMIKFLANDPSVGLFFVQQHAHASMPYLLNLNDKVGKEIHEVTLHTEDIEDSICSVRSMTEHGGPIADEMIKDINKSLVIISASQPNRGLIRSPSWGGPISDSSPQDPFSRSVGSDQHGGSSRSYLSAVFNSAKQKAAGLRWSQPDTMAKGPKSDQLSSGTPPPITGFVIPNTTDTVGDESRRHLDDQVDTAVTITDSLNIHDLPAMLQDFDKFKSEREANYKEWLQESKSHGSCNQSVTDTC